GRYTDDIVLPRMARAFVLRAPMAHARIKRIDAATARGMPGVLFVGTGADVRADGLGDIPCVTPLNNRDGTPRHDTPRPVLAVGAVRHVGEPVALVVAETLAAARDAAEAIEVEYEGLPSVTGAKEAVAPGAPTVALELVNNRVVANSMEPRNAIGDYDQAGDRSVLYTATQGPHFVRDPLADFVLKVPKEKLRLITPNVGGGFGMKAFVYPEH